MQGQFYWWDGLAASGGALPYTWTVDAGWLPWPLTLNQDGVISGVPANVTTAWFTIRVTDAKPEHRHRLLIDQRVRGGLRLRQLSRRRVVLIRKVVSQNFSLSGTGSSRKTPVPMRKESSIAGTTAHNCIVLE